MSEPLVALGTAAWLGILTSISPCPLAANIAAISFIGREVGRPRRVLAAGILYSLGRALTYVLVGMAIVTSMLSIPSLSNFLQERANQLLGPLLVLIGCGIMGWIRLPFSTAGRGHALRERLASNGLTGAALLGALLALSFCPVSAGLFFGGLIPLATGTQSRLLLPAVFGLGTGLPAVVFAVLISLGARGLSRAFNLLSAVERVSRPITAGVFVLAGLYLILTHLFRIGG
ncbi:MAG: sulfite exporter TauE/SafE family protein [Candidatus Eisenbacteria bacterium]|nr:sulfite exporter TauE/SafE family protein [Candidatus Eisenbacteria bacterium]